MKVIICFRKIRVVVPCKNPHMTVGQLQVKACSTYKTIINKGADYDVIVRNLAFACDGGILNEDDEVGDVIENKDKLIAIYDEPEIEPFEGTLKKFLSDFEEIGFDDMKYEDSGGGSNSDRSSNHQISASRRPLHHHPQATTIYNYDVTHQQHDDVTQNDVIQSHGGDDVEDLWNDNFRRNFRHQQSFGKGKVQQIQQEWSTARGVYGGGPQQYQGGGPRSSVGSGGSGTYHHQPTTLGGFNRLNPAHLYQHHHTVTSQQVTNVNNNNHVLMTSYTDDVPTSPPSSLPWFYRKSRHVRVKMDQPSLGLNLTSYDDPQSGRFCGLLIRSIDNNDQMITNNFACGDIIVEINGRILTNYTYEKALELLEEMGGNHHGDNYVIDFRLLPVETTSSHHFNNWKMNDDDNDVIANVTGEPDDDDVNDDVIKTPPTRHHQHDEYLKPRLNSTSISDVSDQHVINTTSQQQQQQQKSPQQQQQSVNNNNNKIQNENNNSKIQNNGTSRILNNISTYSRKIGKKMKIQLQKDVTGLGFTVTSRDTQVGNVISPIYIKKISSRGAAVKDGRLKIGDRILEINGQEIKKLSQQQVVEILRKIQVGSRVDLIISRQHDFVPRQMKTDDMDQSLNSSTEKSTVKDNYHFDIQLNDTGSAGLGISVKGLNNKKTGKGQGIFIKSILHGGAVWQDGRLQVNDQLIEVNGNSLLGISNEEALNIFRTCMLVEGTGMIQVVVTRRRSLNMTTTSSTTSSHPHYLNTSSSNYVINMGSNGSSNGSSNSDVTTSGDYDVEVDNCFNRDDVIRQSISEKRKFPSNNVMTSSNEQQTNQVSNFQLMLSNRYQANISSAAIQQQNHLSSNQGKSNTAGRRKTPSHKNHKKETSNNNNMIIMKKSTSMESMNHEINTTRTTSSTYYQHHESKMSSSMENLLKNSPTTPTSQLTKNRQLNNSFRAALDSSPSVTSSKSGGEHSTTPNKKFFNFKKPKHLKKEGESKQKNYPTTPYKEKHPHSFTTTSNETINKLSQITTSTSSNTNSGGRRNNLSSSNAKTNLNTRLMEVVTNPHHKKKGSYDVTPPAVVSNDVIQRPKPLARRNPKPTLTSTPRNEKTTMTLGRRNPQQKQQQIRQSESYKNIMMTSSSDNTYNDVTMTKDDNKYRWQIPTTNHNRDMRNMKLPPSQQPSTKPRPRTIYYDDIVTSSQRHHQPQPQKFYHVTTNPSPQLRHQNHHNQADDVIKATIPFQL